MLSKPTRNRNWNRDEIILALDLYFDLAGKREDASNPRIIELSEFLNKLARDENKLHKFRNPNGVALKISNLRFFDPSRQGGMPAGSELDRIILEEFYNNRETLKSIANKIKDSLNVSSDEGSYLIDIDEDAGAKEGKRIQRIHFAKERNKALVEKKKKSVLVATGKLECEVCSFDFFSFYGVLGLNFIECHHRVPLSKLNFEGTTKLKDLALVCSNCHRMLHRAGSDGCDIESLKDIIRSNPK